MRTSPIIGADPVSHECNRIILVHVDFLVTAHLRKAFVDSPFGTQWGNCSAKRLPLQDSSGPDGDIAEPQRAHGIGWACWNVNQGCPHSAAFVCIHKAGSI